MTPFTTATATIREWINGGCVATGELARELSEWALWALAEGGEPTHAIIPLAEIDSLRSEIDQLREIKAAAQALVREEGREMYDRDYYSTLTRLRHLLTGNDT